MRDTHVNSTYLTQREREQLALEQAQLTDTCIDIVCWGVIGTIVLWVLNNW